MTVAPVAKCDGISCCACTRQQTQNRESLGDEAMNSQSEVNFELFHAGVEPKRFKHGQQKGRTSLLRAIHYNLSPVEHVPQYQSQEIRKSKRWRNSRSNGARGLRKIQTVNRRQSTTYDYRSIDTIISNCETKFTEGPWMKPRRIWRSRESSSLPWLISSCA